MMAVGAPPQAPPHAPPPGAPPAKPFDPKVTAYVFAGSALAILIGVLTKAWASGRGGEVSIGIGPLGAEVCFGSVCTGADKLGIDGDITFFGYLALLAGLAAAALAGWCAASLLMLRRDRLPTFKRANLVFLVAAGAMAVFAIRLLLEDQITISWSPVFGLGGVIVASVFLRKLKAAWPDGATVPMSWGTAPHHPPPSAPGFGAPAQPPPASAPGFGPPAQPPPSPAFGAPGQPAQPAQAAAFCPRCGAPMTFVAQYQRWFCERCRQYA